MRDDRGMISSISAYFYQNEINDTIKQIGQARSEHMATLNSFDTPVGTDDNAKQL